MKTIKLFGTVGEAEKNGFGKGSNVIRRTSLPSNFKGMEELQKHIESAAEGRVVDISSDYASVAWANGSHGTVHVNALAFLVPEREPFQKKLKWHGKTVGELREFMQQLSLEGVGDEVEFLGRDHLHIAVPLPLATDNLVHELFREGSVPSEPSLPGLSALAPPPGFPPHTGGPMNEDGDRLLDERPHE